MHYIYMHQDILCLDAYILHLVPTLFGTFPYIFQHFIFAFVGEESEPTYVVMITDFLLYVDMFICDPYCTYYTVIHEF